ncbi:hypothetical protein Fmac_024000 [Flemingia macrophylla]|uniref:Uncharacterized protein n=1 Tax=Flemingia macrophylla TaxID=520843 RepID=A0ABD1LN39_9FABA
MYLFYLSDFRAHNDRSPVIDVGYCDSESTEVGLCFKGASFVRYYLLHGW